MAPVSAETRLAPEPLSPLRPQDGRAVALAPTSATALRGVTAERIAPRAAPTVQARSTISTPLPPQRAAQQAPSPEGSTAGGAVNELVTRIRSRLSDTCLIALPQASGDGGASLSMLSADELAMRNFADSVLADIEPRPGESTVLVDNRQCAALNFVRESTAYPTFRLSIGLDEDVIESGTVLTGTIGNTAGRFISLLLVDDNGVVQDISEYLSFTSDAALFEVPLTRVGAARDTSQALIAIATAGRPAALIEQNGQLADVFFAALRAELRTDAPLVIVPFDVR